MVNQRGVCMSDKVVNIIIASVFIGIWLLVIFRILVKAIRNKYAPVIKSKAVVTEKHIVETFSKYAGNGKHEKYVVVFCVDGKKKAFYVSKFSYDGYRINEKGILTYKADKILGFK